MLSNITAFYTTGESTAQTQSMLPTFLMLGAVIILMYFMMFRPQKKKERAETEMRKNLQIGDEVVTVGGIVGIVFSIKEDTVVIETGGDRSKIRVRRYAIAQNLTVHEEAAAIKEADNKEAK